MVFVVYVTFVLTLLYQDIYGSFFRMDHANLINHDYRAHSNLDLISRNYVLLDARGSVGEREMSKIKAERERERKRERERGGGGLFLVTFYYFGISIKLIIT